MSNKGNGKDKQYVYCPRDWTLNPKLTDPNCKNEGHQFPYKKFHDFVRGESRLGGMHM